MTANRNSLRADEPVKPGGYTVTLRAGANTMRRTVTVEADPKGVATQSDR